MGVFLGRIAGSPKRERSGMARGKVSGLIGTVGVPQETGRMLPLLMDWNLKSSTPWFQEQGQEIWFQPQLGH